MSRRWAGCILALLVGLVVGLALDIAMISGSYSSLSWAETGRMLWDQIGYTSEALTYPTGAALSGFLGATGLIRMRTAREGVLVVAVSSLVGAIVAVACSLLFVCLAWGSSNMGCSGLGALRLTIEMPMAWVALAVMTTMLGLLARWIAGPQQPMPSPKDRDGRRT